MKIQKWVDMGAEVDIEIGVDDIRLALAEAFSRLSEKHVTNRNDVVMAINSVGIFLRAVTDEQIAMMTLGQRNLIEKFLSEQALRFKQPVGA